MVRSLLSRLCEGYEKNLARSRGGPFSPTISDALVELHDSLDPSIKSTVLARFACQATISRLYSRRRGRDPSDFQASNLVQSRDRLLAVNDARGPSMEWAWLTARMCSRLSQSEKGTAIGHDKRAKIGPSCRS